MVLVPQARTPRIVLPERHYDLAGHILARAIEDAARDGVPVLDTLRRAATDEGRRLGARPRTSPEESGQEPVSAMEAVADALAEQGYEPRIQAGTLVLVNCPFHVLADEHTALVCGMNLDLITAMLSELGHSEAEARLDPGPGRCCVSLVGIST